MTRSRAIKPALSLHCFPMSSRSGGARSVTRRRCGWLAALLLGHSAGAGAQFSDLVVLGDSNTDAGNAEIIATAVGAPSPTPEDLGYFDGRFSNGPTLADQLKDALLNGNTTPSLSGGLNFSVGGASAATDIAAGRVPGIVAGIPDFDAQVDQYLARGVREEALHMVAFGNNGTVPAVLAGAEPQALYRAAEASYRRQLSRLADAGARYFVIVTNRNIGADPALNGGDVEGGLDAISPVVQGMKQTILSTAGEVFNGRPDTEAYVFDLEAVSRKIALSPEAFGLRAVDNGSPCILTPGALPDCAGYRSFDGIHPTAEVYSIAGRELAVAIQDQYAAPRTVSAFGEAAVLSAWDMLAGIEPSPPLGEGRNLSLSLGAGRSDADREADDSSRGFDASSQSLIAAVSFSPQEHIALNVGTAFERGEVDGSATRFSFDREALRAFIGAHWNLGALALRGALLGGREAVDDYVRVTADGRELRADTEGESLASFLEAAITAQWGKLELKPFLRAEYARAEFDGFTETGGAGLMNLNSRFEDVDTDALGLGIGLDTAAELEGPEWTMRPRFSVAYTRLTEQLEQSVAVSLVDYPQVTRTLDSAGLGEDAVRLEATLDLVSAGGVTVGLIGRWLGGLDQAEQYSIHGQLRIPL